MELYLWISPDAVVIGIVTFGIFKLTGGVK